MKFFFIFVFLVINLTSCQTVTKKIDEKVSEEEAQLSKWLTRSEEELKTEFGKPNQIEFKDNESLSREVGKFANTIFHPVSTCKMGNDENSVVNDNLQVKGINNLRVIDASVMPTITSGNTNAPTMMIAEKGADLIINAQK